MQRQYEDAEAELRQLSRGAAEPCMFERGVARWLDGLLVMTASLGAWSSRQGGGGGVQADGRAEAQV